MVNLLEAYQPQRDQTTTGSTTRAQLPFLPAVDPERVGRPAVDPVRVRQPRLVDPRAWTEPGRSGPDDPVNQPAPNPFLGDLDDFLWAFQTFLWAIRVFKDHINTL